MSKPIYMLGTGLNHDGSSCLLIRRKIIVAIEKERLSRIKHDGGNDQLTVAYCLHATGITLNDLSLVVQCADFEKDEIKKERYKRKRLLRLWIFSLKAILMYLYCTIILSPNNDHDKIPAITISF